VDTWKVYVDVLKELGKLNSAIALLSWDEETHMPKKGLTLRAETIGKLSRTAFELSISDELGRCIEELEKRDDLSEDKAASVRIVGKRYRRNKAVPPDLFEEFTIAQSKSQAAWGEAREASDFALFCPHLEKMVDYTRQFAELYGYQESPYDALLERYESGMTSARLHAIIEPLRERLVPFLDRLLIDGTPPDTSALDGRFPVDAQRALARTILERIGYDFDAGALDDTLHPFTSQIAPGDVRVTNRYLETNPLSGLFGALHEGGHALYDQGMGDDLYDLQLTDGASYGFHESQSRLVENQIGRSEPFWTFFRPVFIEAYPALSNLSAEALYRAANHVSRSPIRVEADEVTYNLHIMLRFELETKLLDGSIQVANLPTLWNDAMDRYVGLTPTSDAAGVLQDVHWSHGLIGYFPSYMLGNLYAAQISRTLREDIPALDEQIARGDFAPLLDWLRDKIHRFGGIYEPGELIVRVTGQELSPEPFLAYIFDKYSKIYGL
jgi:carboxypeptidase Taq